MSWRNDLPDRNGYGLIIPPTAATSEKRLVSARENGLAFTSWHHIYWPKRVFQAAGQLACQFRSSPFNVIALPRFQHNEYHARYDESVVRRYPGEIIPPEDVMATFLDEADLLIGLDVSMRAVDMIDDALYEGRVKHINKAEDNKEAHLEKVAKSIGEIASGRLEIISLKYVNSKLGKIQHLLDAA